MTSGPPRLIGADLHDVATSTRVSLRTGRGPRAVFVIHASDCGGCRTYIQQLVAAGGAFREWDGRVSVVAYEPPEAAARVSTEFPQLQVLSDPDATLGAGKAALLLADEWGEVHFAVQDVADHALPSVEEIAGWMRFIAIQCPECEQPESGWRSLE